MPDTAHLIHDYGDAVLLAVVLRCWEQRAAALRNSLDTHCLGAATDYDEGIRLLKAAIKAAKR